MDMSMSKAKGDFRCFWDGSSFLLALEGGHEIICPSAGTQSLLFARFRLVIIIARRVKPGLAFMSGGVCGETMTYGLSKTAVFFPIPF